MEEIKPNATYTTKEVKMFLHVGEWSLGKRVKEGKLKPTKIGRKYVYLGSDLLHFLSK